MPYLIGLDGCRRWIPGTVIQAWRAWRIGHPGWHPILGHTVAAAIACGGIGGVPRLAPTPAFYPAIPFIQANQHISGGAYGGLGSQTSIGSYAGENGYTGGGGQLGRGYDSIFQPLVGPSPIERLILPVETSMSIATDVPEPPTWGLLGFLILLALLRKRQP